ncbi:MAG: hypothetical protein JNJ75_00275 [Cyclobacteriaceae bacterium]|nr:hypothetical protein [Cyclobacteriaceae bacterium]
MIFGIIFFVLLGIILFTILKPSKKEKQAQAELEERLKDERIYHPETGRYFTLEELENEVIVVDEHINRIKSDEEIQANYSKDQQEIEYVVRLMLQSDLTRTEDERIYELIDRSELFASSDSRHINHLWTITPQHFLGIAHVSYSIRNGKYEYGDSENQIIGIVQGDSLIGELKKVEDIEIINMGNTQLFRVARKTKFQEFKELFEIIRSSDDIQT